MTRSLGTFGIVGCGWLGAALAMRAGAAGWNVWGTTTTREKLVQLDARGVEAFLYNAESAAPLPDPVHRSDVIFLNVPPGRRDPARRAVYARWMEDIAGQISPATQLIFASSTSVYPDLSREVDEHDASADAGGSAAVILDAEDRVRSLKPDAVVLRFGGFYGYDRQPGRFFSGRETIPNGGAPVNMVHRDDAVGIVLRLAEQNVRGETLSVCSEGHPSRSVFYRVWAQRGGYVLPPFDLAPAPWKRVSNRRLRLRLDYAFRYPNPLMPAP